MFYSVPYRSKMTQRVELSTQTHMNYRFYSMENITNNSKDAG